GMQLQVETTALTIFQASREANFCPVLSDLLLYFEKDEARHVGLGSQILPMLMRSMDRIEGARLSAFALEITFRLLASNKAMEPYLLELGIDPRRVLQLAKSKQMLVFDELWHATGKPGVTLGDVFARVMEGIANGLWPPPEQRTLTGRFRAFARGV